MTSRDRSPLREQAMPPRFFPPAITAAMPRPVGVLICDDHPIYREGLSGAISADPRLRLLGEATDGLGAVELAAVLRPDVVLLDLRMPGLDGFDACERIVALRGPRPLVISAFASSGVVVRARQAGAAGFVAKDCARDEICDAIVSVAEGPGFVVRGMHC